MYVYQDAVCNFPSIHSLQNSFTYEKLLFTIRRRGNYRFEEKSGRKLVSKKDICIGRKLYHS